MFLTLNVQYMTTKRAYTKCAYEQDAAARELERVTQKLSDIEDAAGSSTSYKETSLYKSLQAYSTKCENQKNSLAVRMELYKDQMSAFESAMKNDLSSEVSISCWA